MKTNIFYSLLVLAAILLNSYYFLNSASTGLPSQITIGLCIGNFLKAPFFYFVNKAFEKKKRSFAYYVFVVLILQLIIVPISKFNLETELIKLAALLTGIAVVWGFSLLATQQSGLKTKPSAMA